MSRFSIIIPVYKVEQYLDQCVRSVLDQSFRDLEILLVDDGSPDNCGTMCDLWAQQDPRIRVIHQENGGLSAARNTGIRHAQGEYLLFLDSDDWWETENVLGSLNEQLLLTPVDVLSFNYRKSFDGVAEPAYFDEALPSSETMETLEQMVRRDYWVTGACNKAFRRTLVVDNGLYFRQGITSEDIDWTLRIALKAQTFAFRNLCVFVYRQHGASISHSPTLAKIRMLCDNVQRCVELLKMEDAATEKLLEPFVAYQYGTLIYNVANMSVSDRKSLLPQVRRMRYLLGCSDNPKVRLLYRCDRLFGLGITMGLLRLRSQLQQWRGKGV